MSLNTTQIQQHVDRSVASNLPRSTGRALTVLGDEPPDPPETPEANGSDDDDADNNLPAPAAAAAVDVVVGRDTLRVGNACHARTHFRRRFGTSGKSGAGGGNGQAGRMRKKYNRRTASASAAAASLYGSWDFGVTGRRTAASCVKCYKCLNFGHQQLQCALAWCTRCATWGHTPSTCDAAGVSAGGNRQSRVLDDLRVFGFDVGVRGAARGSPRTASKPTQWRRNLPQPALQSRFP
jgi:hypothetical protein